MRLVGRHMGAGEVAGVDSYQLEESSIPQGVTGLAKLRIAVFLGVW